MKKLVVLAMSAMMLMPMFAQEAKREKPDAKTIAEKRAGTLRDSLGLDEAQYQKVYDLFYNDMLEMEAARVANEEAAEKAAADREQVAANKRVEREAALQEILTEEQYKKYNLMKAARVKHHPKGGPKMEGKRGDFDKKMVDKRVEGGKMVK